MKKYGISLVTIVLVLAMSVSLHAAQAGQAAEKPAPLPVQGEKPLDRVTTVGVQLDGTDSIGSRLGMRLKERFNQSNLFTLRSEDGEGVKIWLQIKTAPEFPGRPAVGSIWSVCWVFSQGKGYLRYLLSQEIGTVTTDEIDQLVDKLVERTDGIAARYSNLLR